MRDLLEFRDLTLREQRGLEFIGAIEVILESVLVASGNHEHVGEPGRDGLLDDVLDGRLINHGKHLFG